MGSLEIGCGSEILPIYLGYILRLSLSFYLYRFQLIQLYPGYFSVHPHVECPRFFESPEQSHFSTIKSISLLRVSFMFHSS